MSLEAGFTDGQILCEEEITDRKRSSYLDFDLIINSASFPLCGSSILSIKVGQKF